MTVEPQRHVRRPRHLWRDQRGQELIEFALAAIMFFTVVFGIFEFGRAIWQRNVLAVAVKNGARWTALRSAAAADTGTCSNCGGPCSVGIYNIGCQANQLAVQGYVWTQAFGLQPRVDFTCGPTNSTCDNSNMTLGAPFKVTATMPFTPVVSFLSFATSNITLQSSAPMNFLQ